jgi:hypothetical protein
MIGPRLSLQLLGFRFTIAVLDIALCSVVFAGALYERFPRTDHAAIAASFGIVLAGFFFLIALGIERLRLRWSSCGTPAGRTLVGIAGATTTTLKEAKSPDRAARAGLAGMAIDLTVGLLCALAYLQFNGRHGRVDDVLVAAAIGIGGSAVLRFLTAPSLNGGRLFRWFLELTLDDDEAAIRGTGFQGIAVASLLFAVSIATLAAEGEVAYWGLGLATAAIDIAALSPFTVRRLRWLQTADERRLRELTDTPHPLVSADSPVSELISVFSIDGPKTVAVVQNRDGYHVGIVQFRQLRGAIGAGKQLPPISSIMTPLANLARLSPETTLLDASTFLDHDRRPAVVFESAPGRLTVVTTNDLGWPSW